jgi:hypothetical protein
VLAGRALAQYHPIGNAVAAGDELARNPLIWRCSQQPMGVVAAV